MAYGRSKELRAIFRQLEEQGWTIQLSRSNHYRCKSPDGKSTVWCGSTPSDPRALKNFKAQLRRAGARLK